MRFLIDAQLPPRLARRLVASGHQALHVADIGLAAAPDEQVWKAAIERDAVLVTKDHDFIVTRTAVDAGPTVVWVRLGNMNNEALIARFTSALESMVAAIERGDAVVELVAHARL